MNTFDLTVQCEEIYHGDEATLAELYEEMERLGDKPADSDPPANEAMNEMAQAAENFFGFCDKMLAPLHK